MGIAKLLPPRWWWLILLAMLVMAGALRFTGYNFSLPYIDHPDEPNFNIAAQLIIDTGTSRSMNYQGYPPGIITLNYLILRFFHDPASPPSTIIWMIRLLSITASLLLLIVIALLGRLLATPDAGLLAAALWALNPVAIEHSRYATADTFVALFTVLAVYLVLSGVIHRREGRITAGILANLFGIVFKYQSGFVLPLLLLISLIPLFSPDVDRRCGSEASVRRLLIVGAFGFWLVLIYPSLEANQIAYWVAPTDQISIPSLDRLVSEINEVITTHASGIYLLLLAVAGILLAREHLRRIAVVAVALLCWLIGVALFGVADIRQLIGAVAFTTGLVGVGLAAWGGILARLKLPRRITSVLIAAVTVVLLVPDLNTALADAYDRTLPDRRNDLAHWMDISVPSGRYISGTENHKTFNRDWGGYGGVTQFPFVQVAYLDDLPIEAWRADDVQYAIIGNEEYESLQTTPEGRAELAQTLLLKTFPPSSTYRGPDMVVLRLSPIQHPAQGQLGSIHWVGHDLNTTEAAPGDSLVFRLYWQAERPTDAEYVVFNHLVDTQTGATVAQVDGDPLSDLRRPTMLWDDPAETLISRTFTLPLADVPPGTYQLVTGFYRRDTGERLLSPLNDDSLTVATIEVR